MYRILGCDRHLRLLRCPPPLPHILGCDRHLRPLRQSHPILVSMAMAMARVWIAWTMLAAWTMSTVWTASTAWTMPTAPAAPTTRYVSRRGRAAGRKVVDIAIAIDVDDDDEGY